MQNPPIQTADCTVFSDPRWPWVIKTSGSKPTGRGRTHTQHSHWVCWSQHYEQWFKPLLRRPTFPNQALSWVLLLQFQPSSLLVCLGSNSRQPQNQPLAPTWKARTVFPVHGFKLVQPLQPLGEWTNGWKSCLARSLSHSLCFFLSPLLPLAVILPFK